MTRNIIIYVHEPTCSLFLKEFHYMKDMMNVGDFCSGTYPPSSFHSFFFVIFLSDNMECTDMATSACSANICRGSYSTIFISYCCITKRNITFPKSSIKILRDCLSHEIDFKNLKILKKIYRTWPN